MLHNRNKLWRARKKIFVLVFSDEFPYQVTIRRTYLSRGTYPIRTKVVPFKVDWRALSNAIKTFPKFPALLVHRPLYGNPIVSLLPSSHSPPIPHWFAFFLQRHNVLGPTLMTSEFAYNSLIGSWDMPSQWSMLILLSSGSPPHFSIVSPSENGQLYLHSRVYIVHTRYEAKRASLLPKIPPSSNPYFPCHQSLIPENCACWVHWRPFRSHTRVCAPFVVSDSQRYC